MERRSKRRRLLTFVHVFGEAVQDPATRVGVEETHLAAYQAVKHPIVDDRRSFDDARRHPQSCRPNHRVLLENLCLFLRQ